MFSLSSIHSGVSGNMHKWVYTPRGSAFLWVRREHHATVRPPIMSWAKGMSLSEQFFVQGTRDHIPFLCAKHGLQFYQAIGGMVRVFVLSKVVEW